MTRSMRPYHWRRGKSAGCILCRRAAEKEAASRRAIDAHVLKDAERDA